MTVRPAVRDAILALIGAGIAVGGMALQEDVGLWSWILAPVGVGVMLPLHARALSARGGALRT